MSKTNPGALRRFWRFLRAPSARWSLLTLLVIGLLVGLAGCILFATTLSATSSLAFCSTSCHEMDVVTAEYKKSVHFVNKSGVQATCADCHIPHSFGPKMYAKIRASKEVWGKMTGVIDTPEKFEAKRMEMATNQWRIMTETASRECVGCHAWEGMSGDKQKASNYTRHMTAKKEGKSCIDCHKGVAHNLPKEYHDPDEE